MTRTQVAFVRAGACVALGVLVVVPPVLVAMLIGRPYPDWSTVTDEVDRGQVSTDTVMRVAALLFAAIWVWLAFTIASETLRLLRARAVDTAHGRRASPSTVRRRTTFVHRLVRIAVLGTVTTATTISTWPTAALASGGSSLAGSLDSSPPISAPADPSEATPAPATTTTIIADGRATPLSIAVDLGDETLRDDIVAMNRTPHWTGGVFPSGMIVTIPVVETQAGDRSASIDGVYVVQPNDGLWNVAEALLGDGSRHGELRPLLYGQEVAPGVVFDATIEAIHPGWTFQLLPVAAPPPGAEPDVHVVQPGDTLSSISERHLGEQGRWADLWDLNRGTVMPDGRTFDDPALIVPGWRIVLPTTSAAEVGQLPAADPTPVPTPPTQPESGVGDETPLVPTAPASPPSGAVLDHSDASVPSPLPPQENGLPVPSAPTTAPPTTSAPPAPSDSNTTDDILAGSIFTDAERSVWPSVIAGSLLTAGLAALITRIRRRRLSQLQPGSRLPAPTNTAAGTEHAILARTLQSDIATIRTLLRSITPHAVTHGAPPVVRAVQLGTERIEVLFAEPAPDPPNGWSTIDGGHSWTHRFDEPTEEHRQLLTPALVTIGARTDETADEVLLDLETAGTLAIAGDRDAAIGLARSIVYELATYPLGVSMDVNLIGLDVPGAEHCDRTWVDTTIDRALRVAERRAARRLLDGTTPMDQRAQLAEDDGSTEPQVFIIDGNSLSHEDRDTLDQLIALCQRSSGILAVVVGDLPIAGERIVAEPDGTALWSGVDLTLPNVTDDAADEIEQLMDALATAETELLEPNDLFTNVAHAATTPCSAGNGDITEGSAVQYHPPPYDVLVRVMGEPRVEGVDLTADETELLALLACLRHRTEIHIGLVHESLGPERARKTIENRMSILRRKLGVGSDGHDLLPEAAPGNRGHSHYLVSPLVLTDIDLLEHRYRASDDLNSGDALAILTEGTDMMRGPLFRARRGYEFWPTTEGVTAAAASVLQTYTSRLIELAAANNDAALVVTTTDRASRVLDDPLAELPIRQIERAISETMGDDLLRRSVAEARVRLLAHLDETDPLAESA